MLRVGLFLVALVVSACSADRPDPPESIGWSSKTDLYRTSLFYYFGDPSHTRFTATCDAFPVFAILGGDYVDKTGTFRLIIDDHSWDFRSWAGEHGRALIIQDPHFADAFASARKQVVFRVGDWQRSFKPTSQLANFVAKCRAMREIDPDADGIPGFRNVS